MIKRNIIQRSLRSKSLQKITTENPYEIGSQPKAHCSHLTALPPKQGTEGVSHRGTEVVSHGSNIVIFVFANLRQKFAL